MNRPTVPPPRVPAADVVATSATGTFIEFRGGELDGQMLHLPIRKGLRHGSEALDPAGDVGYTPPTPYHRLDPEARAVADATADALLVSMLDPPQAHDYRASGGFWEDLGRLGRVRLGRQHHLPHRPSSGPHFERILCVVPEAQATHPTPPGDVWTTLVLGLRTDPETFFDTANVLATRHRNDNDVCFDTLTTDQVGRLAESHYRSGRAFDGAVAQAELARRLHERGSARRAARTMIEAAVCGCLATEFHTEGPQRVRLGASDTERRDRFEAAAHKAVAGRTATAAEVAEARSVALARLRGIAEMDVLGRAADSLIGLWMSST